jgi:hypothetical protein
MKYNTAVNKSKNGEFEFIEDIRQGKNIVRYQTPSGKWKTKIIEIK